MHREQWLVLLNVYKHDAKLVVLLTETKYGDSTDLLQSLFVFILLRLGYLFMFFTKKDVYSVLKQGGDKATVNFRETGNSNQFPNQSLARHLNIAVRIILITHIWRYVTFPYNKAIRKAANI